MAELKSVYHAVSKEAAETARDELEEKWASSILWCFSCGDASGKICQYTSVIQRISAKSFTPRMLSNRYIASSGS